MKRIATGFLLSAACILFYAGMVFGEPSVPDLTGKWETITYGHHHEKRGFAAVSAANGKWIIKKQEGRLFYGERTYTRARHDGAVITEGFSGVVSRDGKHLYMVDHDEDILFGDILGNGSIEFVILNDGDRNNQSRIGLIEIKKVK
jgi:hypothetical protein